MPDADRDNPSPPAATRAEAAANKDSLRIGRWVLRLSAAAFLLFWAGGILLRLTIRDRLELLAVWFYGTPPAVLAALAIAAGLVLSLRKSFRLAVIAVVAGLGCGCWWWGSTFYHHAASPADGTLRVLVWNCQHGGHGWKRIAQQIHVVDAGVIGLVEAGTSAEVRRNFWRWEFADYNVATPGGGIVLLTRGTIIRSKLVPLVDGGRCVESEVAIDGRNLTVLVVDIRSNPFVSRRKAIDALRRLIDSHTGEPLLVMGDFNTPTDSVYLDEFRLTCENAFETAGSGYSATWPVPVPVLSLDQVWLSGGLRAHSCRHLWTSVSDHRPVVTELSLRPNAPPDQTSR